MSSGYCKLNPNIDTIVGCNACYKNWPKDNTKYKRALCKRNNWIGDVDVSFVNENIVIHENYVDNCIENK